MASKEKLPPLSEWKAESDGRGRRMRYSIESEIIGYAVFYEIERRKEKWHPRIVAGKHVTYRPLFGFESAEEAYAAILKRCGMA